METDTIVAAVTPPGEGGVGIVRASGSLCLTLAAELFPGLRSPWESHRVRQGRLTDPATGVIIDEALACLMVGPRSYTGEDVLELHCHGNPLVLEQAVALCLRQGCRSARPGEFTLRAFLNGRLDLSQAEAVLDVVRARTNAGLDLALRQLGGWLSARTEPLRQQLVGILAHMEAMVDFVEDDIPPQLNAETEGHLRAILLEVKHLQDGAEQGIVLREGATLAIVGSPNVGKSSIMNGLLGLERSIVTPISGTTRDTVEETLQIQGVPFRAIDTAGITETENLVEQLGVERSHETLQSADVVLLVLDQSRPLDPSDTLALQAVARAHPGESAEGRRQRRVVALNKSDLPAQLVLDGELRTLDPDLVVESSTRSTGGLDQLRTALEQAALGGERHEFVVGNIRHQDALRRADKALQEALGGLRDGTPLDLVSFDVRAATQALGEISGANVDDELLDRIFRDFCIGK
jgi:tRNA modification GTPase